MTGAEETKEHEKSGLTSVAESIASAFVGESKEKEEKRSSLATLTADFLPRIRRGFVGEEKQDDQVVSVGWKAVVRSRREKEEILR